MVKRSERVSETGVVPRSNVGADPARDGGGASVGRVRIFVEPRELRRMLGNMVTAELIGAMIFAALG